MPSYSNCSQSYYNYYLFIACVITEWKLNWSSFEPCCSKCLDFQCDGQTWKCISYTNLFCSTLCPKPLLNCSEIPVLTELSATVWRTVHFRFGVQQKGKVYSFSQFSFFSKQISASSFPLTWQVRHHKHSTCHRYVHVRLTDLLQIWMDHLAYNGSSGAEMSWMSLNER